MTQPLAPIEDRRSVDREEAPAGAATEAALARSAEASAIPPDVTQAVVSEEHVADRERGSLLGLGVAAAGIVYGDIGTSPLYALRECLHGGYGVTASRADVYGVLSLIVWALVLVVSVKYVVFIMRADNRGEGGILALLGLLLPSLAEGRSRFPTAWIGIGLLGAALLYGDGMITPAISVLSAVEGLSVASPRMAPAVVPLTLAILVALFSVQRKGTTRVGRIFGPVMVGWFLLIGALGAAEVLRAPSILGALSPLHAAHFFKAHGWPSVLVLGAVVLAVTGAEALYADMGHFGKRPIRLVWFALVLPCLLLNYFGQGALVLRDPTVEHSFFGLAPGWMLYPLVALATVTTVIAAQALISGAFSLTRQLMHLGYSPLVTVVHTSPDQEGQVYVRQVNWLLLAACLLLVLGFRSSDRLASAYGLAVSGTMMFTTMLFFAVTRWRWGWSLVPAALLAAGMLVMDAAFLAANVAKIPGGGWVPLGIAAAICVLFATWRRGREIVTAGRRATALPVDELVARLDREPVARTDGTAVFLSSVEDAAPALLRNYLDRIRALPEQVVLMTVRAADEPRVPAERRVSVERHAQGVIAVTAHYGYMQSVALSAILEDCETKGVCVDPALTTYFLGRERLKPTGGGRMARWRKRIFIFLHHNAPAMQDFFQLPLRQVLELSTPVEI